MMESGSCAVVVVVVTVSLQTHPRAEGAVMQFAVPPTAK